MNMPKTVMVTGRLPADLVERIDAEAKRIGIPRSHFIERALVAALRPVSAGEVPPQPAEQRSPSASPRARDSTAMDRQARLNKAKDKRS